MMHSERVNPSFSQPVFCTGPSKELDGLVHQLLDSDFVDAWVRVYDRIDFEDEVRECVANGAETPERIAEIIAGATLTEDERAAATLICQELEAEDSLGIDFYRVVRDGVEEVWALWAYRGFLEVDGLAGPYRDVAAALPAAERLAETWGARYLASLRGIIPASSRFTPPAPLA